MKRKLAIASAVPATAALVFGLLAYAVPAFEAHQQLIAAHSVKSGQSTSSDGVSAGQHLGWADANTSHFEIAVSPDGATTNQDPNTAVSELRAVMN